MDLFCVCLLFARCQSVLSSVCSKLDKENALRLQLLFANDMDLASTEHKPIE